MNIVFSTLKQFNSFNNIYARGKGRNMFGSINSEKIKT